MVDVRFVCGRILQVYARNARHQNNNGENAMRLNAQCVRLRICCHFSWSHASRGSDGDEAPNCPHVFHRFEFERVFTEAMG
jgi:hypothetical protein